MLFIQKRYFHHHKLNRNTSLTDLFGGYDILGVCLRNCAQCKKMFGNFFEGQLCADSCVKFKGKVIPDCEDLGETRNNNHVGKVAQFTLIFLRSQHPLHHFYQRKPSKTSPERLFTAKRTFVPLKRWWNQNSIQVSMNVKDAFFCNKYCH